MSELETSAALKMWVSPADTVLAHVLLLFSTPLSFSARPDQSSVPNLRTLAKRDQDQMAGEPQGLLPNVTVVWSWRTASFCLCCQHTGSERTRCVYVCELKKKHDVLSVYDKTVNLNETMPQMLSDLYAARPFVSSAVASWCGHGTWRSQHLLPNPD